MNPDFAQEIAKIITQTFKEMAKTDTVIGKEFKLGEFTVVPVIKVHMGFGTGGGNSDTREEGKSSGGGGGGGLKIEPIAFLVAYGNEVNLLNLGKGKGLEAFFESMPSLVGETGAVIKNLMKKSEKEEPEKPAKKEK